MPAKRLETSKCPRGHQKHRRADDGAWKCQQCNAARIRAKKYGITIEEALSIPDRCSICRRKNKVFVDHDRKTGKFRGWLCHDCNAGLGRFRDQPKLMLKAIYYLRHNHSTKD